MAALAALEKSGVGAWNARAFELELGQERSRITVLRSPPGAGEPGPSLVAYCAARVVADELEILGLAVEPSLRRRGLGRFLLGLSLRRGARFGTRVAFLEVRPSNGAARSLYEGLGFRERGRRVSYYGDPVEDAIVLSRPLA